jgi:hypothetical protein
VSLVYRGGLGPRPLGLQQLARETVRAAVAGRGPAAIQRLGLPARLARFLLYQA